MSVLGIDVGTTTCKGVLLSQDGKILAQTFQNYAEKPTIVEDRAEIPAQVFKEGVFSIIKKLSLSAGDDPVEAVALSTHGETLIPVDGDGNPLYPAILSMDRRAIPQAKRMAEQIGEENFYRICGTPIHSQYPTAKIAWLKENEKEIADKTVTYCTTQDYLHVALGVGKFVDYSLASRFGGFDIRKKKWSEEVLRAIGETEEKFSTPEVAGKKIGIIPKTIASQLHLGENVAVVLGGHDQPCSALGMGAREDTATVSAGSYECLSVMTDEPLNGKDGYRYGLNSYCHVVDGKYVTLAFFASGLMVSWFVNTLLSGKQTIEELEKLAPSTPTGICFTPHVYGATNPRWDDKATAKIVGVTAGAGIGHLYKALLEGASCELDLNVRVLEKLAGEREFLTFCGGSAKSDLWMQLRADMTGREVHRLNDDVDCSCMGASILAGIGCGIFKNADDALAKICYQKTAFAPKNATAYIEQKEKYRVLTGVEL
jgi:xylulokinase